MTHIPIWPTGLCSGCHQPWPAEDCQTALLRRYDRAVVPLSMHMTQEMVFWMRRGSDLRRLTAEQIYQRFLGWIQPRAFDMAREADWTRDRVPPWARNEQGRR